MINTTEIVGFLMLTLLATERHKKCEPVLFNVLIITEMDLITCVLLLGGTLLFCKRSLKSVCGRNMRLNMEQYLPQWIDSYFLKESNHQQILTTSINPETTT